MALFGNRKKDLWATINGMPDNTPGAAPAYDPREAQQEYDPSGQASAGPDAKPKFFGEGGAGRGIAGAIGDYLLQMSHMQPVYAPAMEHKRDMQDRAQMYQQQRQDALADWKTQQDYEQAHRPEDLPEPVKLANYYRAHGRDDLASAVEAKSGAMSGTNAQGQPVVMNPSSLFQQGGGQAQQQPAQGMFTPGQIINGMRYKGGNEEDPNSYEPVGGAGPQTPRTFRPKRLFGGGY